MFHGAVCLLCSCMGEPVRGLLPSLELWHRGLPRVPQPVAIFLCEMVIFFKFLLFAGLSGSAGCSLLLLGPGCVQRGQQWGLHAKRSPGIFHHCPGALPGSWQIWGESVVKVLLVVCISLMMVLDEGCH